MAAKIEEGSLWRSKGSELQVEVVRADDRVVWYVIPAFNGPVDCARAVWDASMAPLA